MGVFSTIFNVLKHSAFMRVFYIWLTCFCIANAGLVAGEMSDARINIGLKLFRAILAADLNIKSKVNQDNKLPILLIYKENQYKGKKFKASLLKMGKNQAKGHIKGLPIQVKAMSYKEFLVIKPENLAGIFVLDKFNKNQLTPIVKYGIENSRITYSPFDGDVENNMSAGLAIGARVRPFVNMETLNKSKVDIKSFFLKVAKKYEP